MKIKKVLAIGLTACFMMQMLTGCGAAKPDNAAGGGTSAGASQSAAEGSKGSETVKVNKEGLPIVEEQQTLRVLTISKNPEIEPKNVVIQQELEDATNVKIEWTIIPSTAWTEKKGLTLAQQDLPDIMLGDNMFTDVDLLNMIEAGQVIALDELMEGYAPNFKTVLKNSEGLEQSITNEDGHIYGLPQYTGPKKNEDGSAGVAYVDRVTYINKKWLDKLNLEMPKTTDDLKQVLAAFKAGDPNGNGLDDEVPLSTFTDNKYFSDWFGYFGLVQAANENKYEYISMKNGEVVFSAMEEEYKAGVQYFHELWKEGLVDPETFTQDSAMFNAKLKAETRTVGMFSAWRGTAWRLNDEDAEYEILPVLEGPSGHALYPQMYTGLTSRAGLVITSSCKNKELAMRWADNLLSPENGYQFWTKAKMGYNLEEVEGQTQYNLVKKIEVTDPEQIRQVMLGFTCIDYTTGLRKPLDPDPLNVDNEKAISNELYNDFHPQEHYPNTFLNLEEGKVISELQPQLKSYVEQMLAKWITTGGVEEEWDSYVEQLKAMGAERYVSQFKSALDRYNTK